MNEVQAERLIKLLGIIARGVSPDWGNVIKKIVDNEQRIKIINRFNNTTNWNYYQYLLR